MKRKKNKKSNVEAFEEVTLNIEDVPLERIKDLIDQDQIDEEIPFEVVAEYYPSLLSEWYPGYPGKLREMTEEDPIPCKGYIKDGILNLIDIPGMEEVPIPLEELTENDEDFPSDGKYRVWILKDGLDFSIHIEIDDEKESVKPMIDH